MSYLALARKWRPKRFDDVVGQPHVVKALSHALDTDKLHPAILLTGTRGVGKTTLARIIAKGLNCETGVTSKPCGTCSACVQVDEGRFVDMLEIDAASHTGVDNVRDLIDNAQYAPGRGRYKVYLIDEVHMLSKPAFNALLKTLEEPPSHVKFILATTDPQKLLVTVLSRCLQFNLRRLPAAQIRELLTSVLKSEGLEAEPAAMAELARAADGSMRDGLSLLDQAIAFAGGKPIARAQVEDMLGTQGRHILFDIVRAVASGNGEALLACVEKLDAQAPDYGALLNDLATILQRTAVLQVLPQAADEDDDPAHAELAKAVAAEDLQVYYQIAVNGRRDLPFVPEPRLGFEMTLLRMLAFRPADSAGVRAAPAARPAGSALSNAPSAVRTAPPMPTAPPKAASPAAQVTAAPIGSAAAAGDLSWAQRIEALGVEGFVKQLARHCEWRGHEGDVVTLALNPQMKHLLQDDRKAVLEQSLSRAFGKAIKLKVDVSSPTTSTPAQQDEAAANDRQRAAEAAINEDPTVRAFKEKFGATVRAGSVQPKDGASK